MKLRNQTNSATRWSSGLAWQALRTMVIGAGLLLSSAVWAAPTVTYAAVDVAGSWHYDYTVNGPIDFFGGVHLVFDYGSYANLASSSSDPSILLNQPDQIALLNGDVFATFDTAALADGSSALFSVSFDWLGTGAPGSQAFDIFDASGNFVAAGSTTATGSTPPPPLPEPSDIALAAAALLALSLTRRRSA